MENKEIERIANIINEYCYCIENNKEYENLLKKYNLNEIVCNVIDEEYNEQYGVSKSDSLLMMWIDTSCYLVDIPFNKFWPFNEPLPDDPEVKGKEGQGYYIYLGNWYSFC